MNNYPIDNDNYGVSRMAIWWFRWHPLARPGGYIMSSTYIREIIHAVVDDFGNLVIVP